ncbi:MAG: FtsB family cell division protein [Chloroflexota bacterium]|jgi:cell division protein FtsB
MAQFTTQFIALSRRKAAARSGLDSSMLLTWLPLVSILMGIVCLFHLVQTSEVTSTGYNIQELQVEEANWKVRNEQLALEVAKAKSLTAIEEEAINRLGMVRPNETVYLQPSNEVLAMRASPSSRGDVRDVPDLEKPAPPEEKNPLMVVQQALASALAPRQQR